MRCDFPAAVVVGRGVERVEPTETCRSLATFSALRDGPVQVSRQNRGSTQHPRHHAHHDELDVIRGEPAENLSVPSLSIDSANLGDRIGEVLDARATVPRESD